MNRSNFAYRQILRYGTCATPQPADSETSHAPVSGLKSGLTRQGSPSGIFRAAGEDRFTVTAVFSAETVTMVSADADGSKLTAADAVRYADLWVRALGGGGGDVTADQCRRVGVVAALTVGVPTRASDRSRTPHRSVSPASSPEPPP